MKEIITMIKSRDFNGLIKHYNENSVPEPLILKELIPKVFKTIDDYKNFMHEFCLKYSIKGVKEELSVDDLISVYVNMINILDELINEWFERVFELFTIYYPEASIKAKELKDFRKIKNADRKTLSKLFNAEPDSMGLDFDKEDEKVFEDAVKSLKGLASQKEKGEERLEKITNERAPNTSIVAGTIVAAKLIAAAHGLKKLMLMPSSTIQVIGAEKALFRHLRGRAKPPKHGIIFHSKFVNNAPLKHRGKMARALASKISISSKVDYFKGEPIGDKLVRDLEEKRAKLK